MCTAAVYQTKDFYFGRNLDLDWSYDETITVTPRNYPFRFRMAPDLLSHYAMIGMAYVADNYPLYYEATNESGLSAAGLSFPESAAYNGPARDMDNIAPFEFIPWLLGQCSSVSQAKSLLARLNMVDVNFSGEIPLSPLHWIVAGRDGCLAVEAVKEGLMVYDDPAGVLTNEPVFPFHMANLANYMSLSASSPQNRFSDRIDLSVYSRGMGSTGLPGGLSSVSRFVKAAFTRLNSRSGSSESESVSQFFHILGSVEQQRGCVNLGGGKYEVTLYSCCCNADKGVYYYTTYENRQITGVDMHRENLEGPDLVSYHPVRGQHILFQN